MSDGNCVIHYHDPKYFGLAAVDYELRNLRLKDWTKPSVITLNMNAAQIDDYEAGTPLSLSL